MEPNKEFGRKSKREFSPRAAVSNPQGRFETYEIIREEKTSPSLQTTTVKTNARTIITRNQSPDVPFELSINPYQGCEHGCIYCFARPSHSYHNLSPGLDFETIIFAKPNAPTLLRNELSHLGYLCKEIVLGANTDPYQPIERELKISRKMLEVMLEFKHPVSVITKSHLILQDLDLLVELAKESLISVNVSVTTLDYELARRMEPRATQPKKRLEVIQRLSYEGIPVCVLASPMIPGLNDMELEKILEACSKAGAKWAGYILVRLPYEIKDLFSEWLDTHYPLKKQKILHLIREVRGGRLYDNRWGKRMKGEGMYAKLLQKRFEVATRKFKLNQNRLCLDTTKFVKPLKGVSQQLPLL